MITGVHIEVNNKDIQEAYAFLRDKLGLPSYDAGGGFLIFEPSRVEMAVGMEGDLPFSPSFICDDLDATMAELEGRGVACKTPVREEVWGRVTEFLMPNGRVVWLYEPKYSKGKPLSG